MTGSDVPSDRKPSCRVILLLHTLSVPGGCRALELLYRGPSCGSKTCQACLVPTLILAGANP